MAAVSCLAVIPYVLAQQCDSGALAGILKFRSPGDDGLIHVTYSITDPNISATERSAIENGIGQWNAVSSSTGVVFEPAAAAFATPAAGSR